MRELDQRLYDGRTRVEPEDIAPMMSSVTPSSETPSGAAGAGSLITRDDHRHPRLTSATVGEVTSGNTATIMFTRLFSAEPTIDYCELPPAPTTTTPVAGDLAANAQPTTGKVIAWVMDGTDPTKYAGCIVRVYKAQVIPQNLVTVLLGAVFNLFGASVVGTRFSIIALARSDV